MGAEGRKGEKGCVPAWVVGLRQIKCRHSPRQLTALAVGLYYNLQDRIQLEYGTYMYSVIAKRSVCTKTARRAV